MGRRLKEDIVGKRFGRLLVEERLGGYDGWHRCLCDCGQIKKARRGHLVSGFLKSCGCLRRKHGLFGSPTYVTWRSMIQRCTNPEMDGFRCYGAKGVMVCDRWAAPGGEGFRAFLEDMGERPVGKTLDRIDNGLGYEPTNCRWSTLQGQALNKSSTKMDSVSVAQLRYLHQRFGIDEELLARTYGIGTSNVKSILRRRTWDYVP